MSVHPGGGGGGTMYTNRPSTSSSRKPRPPNVALPVDADDYLVPSPQSPPPATPNTINNNMKMHMNPYMDLISDNGSKGGGMFIYPPPHGYYPGTEKFTNLDGKNKVFYVCFCCKNIARIELCVSPRCIGFL
jgi:hypothetical protein